MSCKRRNAEPSECPCGDVATTTVAVSWADGERCYRYCEDCAEAITDVIEGAEILP